ncbi:AIG2 family protein [Stackebrandtia albiflava]|uniref:AIG2 family protein n=1 Tax=Stackebrandtia albiflava TaxID=406432 RepID=A0A562V4C7_9ACTN|nr:gamma-glutamylcyclotransferase family protein [Stackebrandtia albiflava]TWJ12736.1 AIG2 family protein [Stackebrandtia albiflava]
MPLYAAYGSNLDPGRMRATCPRSPMVGTGWLEGWRLTFGGRELGWESVVSTVVEDAGERTFVALYDVESTDAGTLDELEGATGGTYRRIHTTAATLNGDQPVWLYVLNGYEGGLPSVWYLAELAAAAEKAGAPADYIAALRKHPTTPS